MINFIKAFIFASLAGVVSTSFAATYWVSKTGNDASNCASQSTSCATIQKGLSLLVAGDTLNIDEGTYIEDSAKSPYTVKCGLLDANYGSLCVLSSGTIDKPIVIQAVPGKEVIINSEGKRAGIIIRKQDYIHIKNLTFINSWTGGIATPGGPAGVPEEVNLSIGCLIEGNTILNTVGANGVNNSAIYMWSTKDWIVRNNVVRNVYGNGTSSNGIQTYGTLNALIENNTITDVDHGINWKDHYVSATGDLYQESIIRNNRFSVTTAGVRISIRGDGSNPAGHNQIERNIFELMNNSAVGVAAYLSGANAESGNLEIRNNLFVGKAGSHKAINVDALKSLKIVGNVFAGIQTPISLRLQQSLRPAKLVESEYNVFETGSLQIQNDKYSEDEENYNVLSAWQAAKPSQDASILSLRQDNPDQYSILQSGSKVFDTEANDYKGSSPKLNGPNGAYQTGPYQDDGKIVGSTRKLVSKPQPPKPL